MRKIKIIGVGPGNPSYLTPEAEAAMQEARLLIGGKRHLNSFAGVNQETYILSNNFGEVIELIGNRRESGIAILTSGDPGMYGMLGFLLRYLKPEDLEVIPGISSVQLAFAKLLIPWHDAVILSAHGRPTEELVRIAEKAGKIAILTGTDNPPEKIYNLINQITAVKKFYFCFDLSLPGEAIIQLRTGQFYPEEFKGRHNCVMVMVNE